MGKANKYKDLVGLSQSERVLRQIEMAKTTSSNAGISTKCPSAAADPDNDRAKKEKKRMMKRSHSQQQKPRHISDHDQEQRKRPRKSKTRQSSSKNDPDDQQEDQSMTADLIEEDNNGEKKNAKTIPSLKSQMMQKLSGARFRYINELLYTKSGEEAKEMFANEPELFDAYHDGYEKQKSKWPYDPLDNLIKQIRKLPADLVIADLGCGDARLAASVKQTVHSFDLISVNERVVATDIAQLPLPNSSVDVCVFCLSLMGTNLVDYICEASRILKKGGLMKIVEIRSRFESISSFKRSIERLGFQLSKQVKMPDTYFVQMDYEKVSSARKRDAKKLSLKPCLYKKR